MTIDMLRHTSLRELVARALYDSPPPAGTWPVPAAAHGASFAVRNLPHDTDPERAVSLMEATVAAAPELKRRHGVKGWRVRVRKPALVYTLHWQEGPPSDEELLIHKTLELLPASELQAVIIRRSHGQTSRTAVVLNTVHPQTGLVKVNGQVCFDLLHWRLSREGDAQAQEALQRGKVSTMLESLRRQDRRILKLPERIQWAVEYLPTHLGKNTLDMFLRCGPSGW